MGVKTDSFAGQWLKHWFQNAALPDVGDGTGLPAAGTVGNIYLSLHTADPGDTTTAQTTSEISYTGYARQATVRSSAGWTYTAGNGTNPSQVANAALIQWGQMTAGAGGTVLYVGFGSAVSGAGVLYSRIAVTTPASGFPVTTGINPEAAIGALVFKEE